MKGDRWSELRREARPKAVQFAKKRYFIERERNAAAAGYMSGYFAGATRGERRGRASKKKCGCSNGACSQCYAGPVATADGDPDTVTDAPVASEEQRLKSALITVWENLSTIRPDDFKQPDGEAETQVNRAYCAAENALLEVGRLRREGHSVELVPTKGAAQ